MTTSYSGEIGLFLRFVRYGYIRSPRTGHWSATDISVFRSGRVVLRTARRSKSSRSVAAFCGVYNFWLCSESRKDLSWSSVIAILSFLNFCTSDFEIPHAAAVLASHFWIPITCLSSTVATFPIRTASRYKMFVKVYKS
jgi:hypothetical protein